LYSFTGGSDGANPQAELVLSSNTLYGVAAGGGNSGVGTVFAVNTDGSNFTDLYSFTGSSDGAVPQAALILSGDTLYGTTVGGGDCGTGTLFKIETDGSGFVLVTPFSYGDGFFPSGDLVFSGTSFYGITERGGSYDAGTVFKINADGSG
jgi:uncharacterized repeat protein (TIGR03803 family)